MADFLSLREVDTFLSERRAARSGNAGGFRGVATDSRATGPGDLFVALRGDAFDGHTFVAAAREAGAAGAVVSAGWAREQGGGALARPGFALWTVDDTLLALGDLARGHLRRLDVVRGALSGSNGKTTTKELTASILRAHHGDDLVLWTRGNLNNQVGMPQTALLATERHRVALFEMGMNHAGELAALARVAEPRVGLVTNVGPAHIGNFGGELAGVAQAKGELFRGVVPGGVLVVNLDDDLVVAQADTAAGRGRVTYGRDPRAEVRIVLERQAGEGTEIALEVKGRRVEAVVPALGAHNALNACAAVALATALGAEVAAVAPGLAAARLAAGRLTRRRSTSGATVLDDSYNANPASMKAAMEVARREADLGGGRLVLVLADMLELGTRELELHAEVGVAAAAARPAALWASGVRSRALVDAALQAGLDPSRVHHAPELDTLLGELRASVQEGDVVLVKGSRGSRTERAVVALCGAADGPAH